MKNWIEMLAPLVGPQVLAQMIQIEEITKEIFGSVGYKDGKRFINTDLGEKAVVQQLMEMIQQLQAQLEDAEADRELQRETTGMRAEADIQEQVIRGGQQMDVAKLNARKELILEGFRQLAGPASDTLPTGSTNDRSNGST